MSQPSNSTSIGSAVLHSSSRHSNALTTCDICSNRPHLHCVQTMRPKTEIKITRVSAAADRPARRRGSTHAKHSVSHHMVIKPLLLLGLAAEYRFRRWVWSTVVRRPSEVYDRHSLKLTAPETTSRSRDILVPTKI